MGNPRCGRTTAAATAAVAMRRDPGGNPRCDGCRDEGSGSGHMWCKDSGSGCGYAAVSWGQFSLRWLPR
ncbi:hypothetical protein NDU88_002588 [Pleurodeles waltl]|uniref:Uncharacterized protein n=1 Tax=Pleurodeles waltl TaxID=8319 RepID=A0AAV7M109_PLEWA|nr:hypothetical protein NDU88_002588 [Pleurodeles waltl]